MSSAVEPVAGLGDNTIVIEEGIFLAKFIEPIRHWLEDDRVSEVCVNEPGTVWVERAGERGMTRHETPDMDAKRIEHLARQVAAKSSQSINAQKPLLSAALPTGERIQFVLPPCAPSGGGFSIRKQVVQNLSLDDYVKTGAFAQSVVTGDNAPSPADARLLKLLDARDIPAFITTAIKARKNIIVAGGTSTGKTTFLNAITKEIDTHERLITIEDTPEVVLEQPNVFRLLVSRGDQGDAHVNIQDLLEASMRLRPDRILLGELRGAEAYTFLQAINTGHPGSITTLHADSPGGAFERLALMVMQSRLGLGRDEIMAYIRSIVDIVIQLSRQPDGSRVISEVYYPHDR